MTVQNGLGAEEIVRRHGDWPLISAVTFMSGNRRGDAEVEYILDTETWLGPYGDTTYDTVERTADLIVRSGLKARAFEDLRPAQWSKLIFNATVNSVSALTHLPHDAHFADRRSTDALGHVVHELVEEGKRVAAAAGVDLHDDPWEMNVLATQRGSAHVPSMLEDIEAGRPTEIDLITGALVREAERPASPSPCTRRCSRSCARRSWHARRSDRLRRSGEPVRRAPRPAGRRRGLGVRPGAGPRRRDQRARAQALGRRRPRRPTPGDERRGRASAVRIRHRRGQEHAHRRRAGGDGARVRGRRRLLRPERDRQRGADREARRAGHARHDLPGRSRRSRLDTSAGIRRGTPGSARSSRARRRWTRSSGSRKR